MKSTLSILLILTLFIGSCRKDKVDKTPVPIGTIVADINGTKTTFNAGAIADTVTSFFDFWRNSFILSVTGMEIASVTPAKIKIWFMTVPASPIGPGTYTDLDQQIYAYIDFKKIWNYSVNGYEPYTCKASITSIDSTVQGTFSGKVIVGVDSTGGQAPLSFTIRNGKFNVRIRWRNINCYQPAANIALPKCRLQNNHWAFVFQSAIE